MRKGRRRDDITFLRETDTAIVVRWNRPLPSIGERFTYRNGRRIVLLKNGKPAPGWEVRRGRIREKRPR